MYEAEQISLQHSVALKVLPLAGSLDPCQHQRFLVEDRAAACLHHPNIVTVYAVGSERGVPYYAMQFIDGSILAQILRALNRKDAPTDSPQRPPGSSTLREPRAAANGRSGSSRSLTLCATNRDPSYIRTAAEHIRCAAEALDHAHGRGMLHRDIKPANLMIDGNGHLWVTDFGLARIQGDTPLTFTGDLMGTLRYMSPEQVRSKRVVVDGRTDIYSLGATLYELLARRPAFAGSEPT